MFSPSGIYALAIVFGVPLVAAQNAGSHEPELVAVRSGDVSLRALLWRPAGTGPFPAVLLNHGSGRTREELERLGPYEKQAEAIGPVFARHGYVFMYLFRRGVGLSADQGVSSVDVMNREAAEHGQTARNALQLQLLENREAIDARAALAFLRARSDVDRRDVALVGDSFGSSLTLVVGERRTRFAGSRRVCDRRLQLGPLAGTTGTPSRVGGASDGSGLLHPRRERLHHIVRRNVGCSIERARQTAPSEDLSPDWTDARRGARLSVQRGVNLGERRVRVSRSTHAALITATRRFSARSECGALSRPAAARRWVRPRAGGLPSPTGPSALRSPFLQASRAHSQEWPL